MKKYIIVSYNINKHKVSGIVKAYPMELDHALREFRKTPCRYPNTELKIVEIGLEQGGYDALHNMRQNA